MTGTPSKDRAEAHKAAVQKFYETDLLAARAAYDRLGRGSTSDEQSLAIAFAKVRAASFAEGMKRAAEIAAKRFDLRDDTCARIAGARIADAITKEAEAK